MHSGKKITSILIIMIAGSIWFYYKYIIVHPFKEETLIFNPFKLTNDEYQNLSNELKKPLTPSIKSKICNKMLQYYGSHNEGEYEKVFTDGNGLYGYKIRKALDYSMCFENQNDLKSALNVLSPLMSNVESRNYPIQEKFFELALKLYGKEKVLQEIDEGLNSIIIANCDYCYDRCYKAFETRIGIISEYSAEIKGKTHYYGIVENEPYYKKIKEH